MKNGYIEYLRKKVLEVLRDEDVKVVLFGSRARGDNHRRSDVDIGLIPRKKLKAKTFSDLREKIEELNIPYKVEIINLNEAADDFRAQAMKKVTVWKD